MDPARLTYLRVNPIYYVGFTTSTLIASAILFAGFNTTGGVNTFSLLCGFVTIFLGVYLLNISQIQRAQRDEDFSEPLVGPRSPGGGAHHSALETGLIQPRMSLSLARGNLHGAESRPLTDLGQGHSHKKSGGGGGASGNGPLRTFGNYEEVHTGEETSGAKPNGRLHDPDAQLLYSFDEDSDDETNSGRPRQP